MLERVIINIRHYKNC